MSQAGLDEMRTLAPLVRTVRRRAIWLGINLLTAFAAAVIGMFEATIERRCLWHLDACGCIRWIAGTQALTIVFEAWRWASWLRKHPCTCCPEVLIGVANGCLVTDRWIGCFCVVW